MAFQITKGKSFVIDKGHTTLYVGTSWDPQLKHDSEAFDVDLHLFGLCQGRGYDSDGSHALTYANKRSTKNPEGLLKVNPDQSFETADGSMYHKGDNTTGAGPGDDEYAKIFTEKLPKAIDEIAVYVTIHEAASRHQNFGRVLNAAMHIDDFDTKDVLGKYDLSAEFSEASCVHIGSFIKDPSGEWSFKGAESASSATLLQILQGYGLV